MEYPWEYVIAGVAITVGAAGILLCGIYLHRRRCYKDRTVSWPVQAYERKLEPQAGVFRRAREESEVITVSVDLGEYKAPRELKHFIRDQVIPDLNLQRNDRKKHQFAAMILSDKNLSQINELQLALDVLYCITSAGHNTSRAGEGVMQKIYNSQLVNPDKVSHPDNSNIVNYIVARPGPDVNNHAEDALLNRFDDLWLNYKQQPSLLLIFSWFMPCKRCTKAIITKFENMCEQYQVIVVFRSNYQYCSAEENEKNRKKLREAKFEVYHVSYSPDLPSD